MKTKTKQSLWGAVACIFLTLALTIDGSVALSGLFVAGLAISVYMGGFMDNTKRAKYIADKIKGDN